MGMRIGGQLFLDERTKRQRLIEELHKRNVYQDREGRMLAECDYQTVKSTYLMERIRNGPEI